MSTRTLSALALVAAAMVLGLVGTPAAASAASAPASVTQRLASVDDFTFESLDVQYTLGRDAEGRSTLRTVEHFVAVFPEVDQNRGFIRDLPRNYDGHPTDIEIVSVTDAAGNPRPFELETGPEYLSVVMAVPRGEFVHGRQSYVIEYTQRDVTAAFADTNADEFYWDVNGTDWRQTFDRISARITVSDGLWQTLTGSVACYRGVFGATDPCALVRDDNAYTVTAENLFPGHNITVALGFAPGTFTPRPFALFEKVPPLLFSAIVAFAGALLLAIGGVTLGRRSARVSDPVIAQFDPPDGVDVALAAHAMKVPHLAMTATLLDLAVRGKIQLLHDAASGSFGARPVDAAGLGLRESVAYSALGVGGWFTPADTALGDAAAAINRLAKGELRKGQYFVRLPLWVTITFVVLTLASLGLLILYAVSTGSTALLAIAVAAGANAAVWFIIGVVAALLFVRRGTKKLAILRNYLEGMRLFIRLAEADRIRMLQSVRGAEVTPDYVVKLYERLLPYAVIFGYEREWQAELARHYRTAAPEWLAGSDTSFDRLSLAHLRTTVTSARATPRLMSSSSSGSGSSFSSSGGSSGGGSSGGGGGGGGGRGI